MTESVLWAVDRRDYLKELWAVDRRDYLIRKEVESQRKYEAMRGLMEVIHKNPVAHNFWSMWLRGGFESIEDMLINLVAELAKQNRDLCDAIQQYDAIRPRVYKFEKGQLIEEKEQAK